jgi:hypothetical protein
MRGSGSPNSSRDSRTFAAAAQQKTSNPLSAGRSNYVEQRRRDASYDFDAMYGEGDSHCRRRVSAGQSRTRGRSVGLNHDAFKLGERPLIYLNLNSGSET